MCIISLASLRKSPGTSARPTLNTRSDLKRVKHKVIEALLSEEARSSLKNEAKMKPLSASKVLTHNGSQTGRAPVLWLLPRLPLWLAVPSHLSCCRSSTFVFRLFFLLFLSSSVSSVGSCNAGCCVCLGTLGSVRRCFLWLRRQPQQLSCLQVFYFSYHYWRFLAPAMCMQPPLTLTYSHTDAAHAQPLCTRLREQQHP